MGGLVKEKLKRGTAYLKGALPYLVTEYPVGGAISHRL